VTNLVAFGMGLTLKNAISNEDETTKEITRVYGKKLVTNLILQLLYIVCFCIKKENCQSYITLRLSTHTKIMWDSPFF